MPPRSLTPISLAPLLPHQTPTPVAHTQVTVADIFTTLFSALLVLVFFLDGQMLIQRSQNISGLY